MKSIIRWFTAASVSNGLLCIKEESISMLMQIRLYILKLKPTRNALLKVVILTLIFSMSINCNAYAVNLFPNVKNKSSANPPAAVVWAACIVLGAKYQVPPEIIYSVGYHESDNGFNQFDENNGPLISCDKVGVGIMQITFEGYKGDARVKLEKNWYYNLEEGVKVLKSKWNMAYTKDKNGDYLLPRPKINDPMILENWYFALWAYNGFNNKNNPLIYDNVYQEKVIKAAKKSLGIKINLLTDSEVSKVIYTQKSKNKDAYKGYYVFATDTSVKFSAKTNTYSCLHSSRILTSSVQFIIKYFPLLKL